MSALESMAVLFPRYTTLAGNYVFASPALDVGRFGGMQLRVWWSERLGPGGANPTRIYLDESLDGVDWPTDGTTMFPLPSGETYSSRFFSIGFRMRWFRMRIDTGCDYVTVWAEGVLRAGAMGAKEWVIPRAAQDFDEMIMLGKGKKRNPLALTEDSPQRGGPVMPKPRRTFDVGDLG